MSMDPDVEVGLDYWATQPASYDGVLGGFGTGTLPRIDALGSRLFLLHLLPELSTVPSALRPLNPPSGKRTRALDVGAGIGRVTADVLLHLVNDVVLLEPAEHFVNEALARARASVSPPPSPSPGQKPWPGLATSTTSVTLLRGTLQSFDPALPHHATMLDRLRAHPVPALRSHRRSLWCLGHLSDLDLAAFLRRSKKALRVPGRSVIVVKENLCSDEEGGGACTVFDEQDSSLTRSDRAWKDVFDAAGLTLVNEQVQEGLPDGLYVVKMYVSAAL
ncbi:Alpha N-terminal protein methyltransferase 1 [Mycena sanguinolenta]|uniref:Alpha N-terminal protein methyltransferase 1 n=1 Tax=Mycena sanguinolenta TaxID=230812 RepID=A0A8H6YQV5_9AGAR|nr:Alpha N-terminal protein methyltransferase 1 [Mycena sanguinolenta]